MLVMNNKTKIDHDPQPTHKIRDRMAALVAVTALAACTPDDGRGHLEPVPDQSGISTEEVVPVSPDTPETSTDVTSDQSKNSADDNESDQEYAHTVEVISTGANEPNFDTGFLTGAGSSKYFEELLSPYNSSKEYIDSAERVDAINALMLKGAYSIISAADESDTGELDVEVNDDGATVLTFEKLSGDIRTKYVISGINSESDILVRTPEGGKYPFKPNSISMSQFDISRGIEQQYISFYSDPQAGLASTLIDLSPDGDSVTYSLYDGILSTGLRGGIGKSGYFQGEFAKQEDSPDVGESHRAERVAGYRLNNAIDRLIELQAPDEEPGHMTGYEDDKLEETGPSPHENPQDNPVEVTPGTTILANDNSTRGGLHPTSSD